MYLSENWELLNNQSQHSQKQKHELGIKECRSSLSNCYYTLESSSFSEWLPDHVQGQLNTSIGHRQLWDNVANKIPGCPMSYYLLCCASDSKIESFIYLQWPSFKHAADECFQEKEQKLLSSSGNRENIENVTALLTQSSTTCQNLHRVNIFSFSV